MDIFDSSLKEIIAYLLSVVHSRPYIPPKPTTPQIIRKIQRHEVATFRQDASAMLHALTSVSMTFRNISDLTAKRVTFLLRMWEVLASHTVEDRLI